MNLRYFILTIALISTISYTAEGSSNKSSRKSTSALLDKKPRKKDVQMVTHICSLIQQIKFNNEKKTLIDLLDTKEFGVTPMFSTHSSLDDYRKINFIEEGPVNSLDKKEDLTIALAKGNAIYISNIQEKTFIKYGALVFHFPLDRTRESAPATVEVVTNFFLLWWREQKSLQWRKLDQKKQEPEISRFKILEDYKDN